MIVVIGAGAIGCVVAGLLSQVTDVLLIARGKRREEVANGVFFKGKIEKKIKFKVAKSPIPNGKIDFVLLAVKAFDTESAITEYLSFIDEKTLVVSLSNGMGSEEILEKYVNSEQVIGGVTYIGAQMLSSDEIKIHGLGKTVIGFWKKRANEISIGHSPKRATNNVGSNQLKMLELLKESFERAGMPCEISQNIKEDIARKFVVNIGLNAVGAIYKANNVEVGERDDTRTHAIGLMKEAIAVLKKDGVLIGDDFVERFLVSLKALGPNKNSMWASLDNQKKTEIDFLNGKVVELGKKHRVSTPLNTEITKKIKAMEKS